VLRKLAVAASELKSIGKLWPDELRCGQAMFREARIFIRHSVSGRFLASAKEWTREFEDARLFETPEEALEFLRLQEVEDGEVVIKPEKLQRERRFSCVRLRRTKIASD